jgi:hypothetical protein
MENGCTFPVTRQEDDDALTADIKLWFRIAGPEFHRAVIQALVPRWLKAVERDEDYVRK